MQFAIKKNGVIHFLYPAATYLLKGVPFLHFYGSAKLSADDKKDLLNYIDFYSGQPIARNPYYGYHQLTEVAIKALSPGINDPETAVLSLHAITDLFHYRLHNFSQHVLRDENNQLRVVLSEWSFEELFRECYYPIWDYGKNDRYIREALQKMTNQLKASTNDPVIISFLTSFCTDIEDQTQKKKDGKKKE